MTPKWPIFTGIVILITGVLLRIFSSLGFWAILIIILGASLKIYYIILKIRNKEYKPGFEVFILYTGVALFFTGVYLRTRGADFNPYYLMGPGIAFKLTFIGIFIAKSRLRKIPVKE